MTTLKRDRPKGTATQVGLAALLAALVAVTLWWGFVREHAPLGPKGIRVDADFTTMQDGPAPTRFDGGQPATMLASPDDAADRLRIEHGQLTYRPTAHGKAGAFFSSPDLGSSVKGLGARFVFRPGATMLGSVTLVVSRGVENRIPPLVTPLAAQFVVTPVNWYIAVSRSDTSPLDVVAADSLPRPLKTDGVTGYDAHLTIDGDQITIDLPGVHRVVTDPRFSEWQGSFATFELFSNDGATDSIGAFEKIWASGYRD